MSALLVAALAALGGVATAQTAQEQQLIDQTVLGLQNDDDDVYVAEGADLSEADAAALAEQIDEADVGDVFVVVLPAPPEGTNLNAVIRGVGLEIGRDGTYVLVGGQQLRAGSSGGTPFERGEVPAIADAVVEEGGSTEQVLANFVDALDAADTSSAGVIGLFLLAALVVGGAVAAVAAVRRRRRAREQTEEVRQVVEEDMTTLGNELFDLEQQLIMPDTHAEARADYHAAINEYTRARSLLDHARRPNDLRAVTEALNEGRFLAAEARAHIEGRPLPERRPPCFFDPRHGPSTRDVEWMPAGGISRVVPACEADAIRVESGEEPLVRELEIAGR
ncbi:MAG: DUF6676 family protein, partial [Egibacteraceae bacterium]